MHDLIEHCVAVTVLCTPPQRCIRGHVGVFRSYAVAWPRLCARLSPLPLCRTLSGAAAESAQYDRVKHDMCVTKMRARDWPRTMPRTTKHRGARPGSNPSRRDPGDGVSLSVTSRNANGRGAIAARVPSASHWVASCPFVISTYSWTVLPSVRHGQRRGTCGARGGRCGCTAGMSAICRRTSLGRSQSLSLGRCCLVVCARQRHGFLEQALKLHHVSKVSCECMSELLMQVSMDLNAASMW